MYHRIKINKIIILDVPFLSTKMVQGGLNSFAKQTWPGKDLFVRQKLSGGTDFAKQIWS